jgi:hypothetical protein
MGVRDRGSGAAPSRPEKGEENPMQKLVRFALAFPAAAIVALSSVALASADNGIDLAVAPRAELTAGVQVVTTITVTCPSGWLTMTNMVTVEEAVGKSIARASGYMLGVVCTGQPQVIPVSLLADPSGPPLKKGTAVLNAQLYAYDYSTFTGAYATTTVAVRLK